jgi:hypothetical protein
MRTLWLLPVVVPMMLGCATAPNCDGTEVRTHHLGTAEVKALPQWSETITATVAPERWNRAFSPHKISHDRNTLTVRTTRENHEKILKYLGQAAAAAG